jgi:amino acid transporter
MSKKRAVPGAVKLGILLVLVLAVLFTFALVAMTPTSSLNHQVAEGPVLTAPNGLVGPGCLHCIQPLANWDS